MTGEREANSSDLNEILAEYLQRVDAGEAVDREALMQQHPEFADELREFLADDSQWKRVARADDSEVSPTMDVLPRDVPEVEIAPTFDSEAASSSPKVASQRIGYFGDYELLEEIARGGMGVVYKARQVNLDRTVALKMILSGQLASDDDVRRFYQEAEAAANLDHPGVVPIYEIGQHQGQHFFSMAHVDGPSLAELLTDGPLPPREAARVLQLVAEAIDFAHSRGVIHRDLKPANILLQKEEGGRTKDEADSSISLPKVSDFGLAKRMEGEAELTGTGQILGTPSYMPPEQAAGGAKDIGPAADIYSLGAILYASIVGHPPFQSANPMDTLQQVLHNSPAPPRLINPSIPRDLETICLKCLEKEPEKRYGSAADLADDLYRFLNDEPIRAQPVGPLERTRRWLWKRRRMVAAVATAALLTAAVVVGGWWGWRKYDQWRRGDILLLTNGPTRVAEILNDEGSLVVPRFSVPTAEPVSLPAGEYRLRLSAPHHRSESWRILVWRGQQREYTVGEQQSLWPPIEIARDEHFEVVRFGERDDLLVFTTAGVRRVSGETTETLWETGLDAEDHAALADVRYGGQWKYVLDIGGNWIERPPMVLNRSPDLNGDGMGDAVITVGDRGDAIALSGETGEVLWAWTPDFPQPERGSKPREFWPLIPTQPSIVQIDEDNTPDLVFTFLLHGTQWCVEAVSGTTGRTLWRRTIVNDSSASGTIEFSETIELGDGTFSTSGTYGSSVLIGRAQAARFSNVAALIGTWRTDDGLEAVALNPSDGGVLWRHELSIDPLRAPKYLDLNGDGSDEALIASSNRLIAWKPEENKTLWTAPLRGNWREGMQHRVVPELDDAGGVKVFGHTGADSSNVAARRRAIVVDLDGNGGPEIVLPGPCVIDGVSGAVTWQRNFNPPPSAPHEHFSDRIHEERWTVGHDIDGDGLRDVILVTLDGENRMAGRLTITALSGQDGSDLWTNTQEIDVYVGSADTVLGPLTWDAFDSEGRPLLLAHCRVSGNGYAFSTHDGKLAHMVEDIFDPNMADFNGDGLPELWWFDPNQENTWKLPGGSLQALLGRPPAVWRRPEPLIPARDFDGDGITDLTASWRIHEPNASYAGPLTVVSGRDGRLLWKLNGQVPGAYPIAADLDGDGLPDVIVQEIFEEQSPYQLHLSARSGKTGASLWSSNAFDDWTKPYLRIAFVNAADLDRDGKPEVVLGMRMGDRDFGVAVLSRDGSLRWRERWLVTGASSARVQLGAVDRLDGDAVADLVTICVSDGLRHFRALRGDDGQSLWERTFPRRNSVGRVDDVPRQPTIDLDDDGQAELLVIDDRVMALDGGSGEVEWSWVWPDLADSRSGSGRAGGDTFVPLYDVSGAPSLADLDGDGEPEICLQANRHFIALNTRGELVRRTRLPQPGHRPSWEPSDAHLWPIDVDDDGRDELIFLWAVPQKGFGARYGESPVHIRATADGVERTLWQWHFPAGWGEIVDVLPATENREPIVVVRTGNAMYGLSAATGKPRWRCEDQPWWYSTSRDVDPYTYHRYGPVLLDAHDSRGPLVMFRHFGAGGKTSGVVCRRALPTDDRGHYLSVFRTQSQPIPNIKKQ